MEKIIESALTAVNLSGFKSLLTKQSIKFGPLTLLSGANSSGKSSVTQALLLLKQTFEAPYDPGALLLNGPNVRITSANQVLSNSTTTTRSSFSIGLVFADGYTYESYFKKDQRAPSGIELEKVKISFNSKSFELSPRSSSNDIEAVYRQIEKEHSPWGVFSRNYPSLAARLARNRCEFEVKFYRNEEDEESKKEFFFSTSIPESHRVRLSLLALIHVPGLRGNPERTYATTAVGKRFPGRFENYVASIIRNWQETKSKKFDELSFQLQNLGLTASIRAQRRSDTEVELKVSRKKNGTPEKVTNLVSIADVGFGVSQVLPVLVALLAAEKNQFVIIEQPELHLHPRAQTKLAQVIASAVNRGVRVVIETHSSLLLLGLQTAVAQGNLSPANVALNWFTTNDNGHTRVTQGELNELGGINEWPTDFMDVRIDAESAYLDAVERKMIKSNAKE